MKKYQWIIFASANAVDAFWRRLHELDKDSRVLGGIKIGAIGPATAQALKNEGIVPDYIPETNTGEGVVTGLSEGDIAGQRFLLPRADIADKALVEGLKDLGASVEEIAVYRTVPASEAMARAREMLLDGKIDVITFSSSSTVSSLTAAFNGEPLTLNGAKVACIGPKTAGTAVKAGLKVDIMAEEQTIPGLVEAIESFFEKT